MNMLRIVEPCRLMACMIQGLSSLLYEISMEDLLIYLLGVLLIMVHGSVLHHISMNLCTIIHLQCLKILNLMS
nr:MAG TPA: hypothetical protein [Caudoviricetes sp.]